MTVSDGTLTLVGPFNRGTASRLLEEGRPYISKGDVVVDFSAVTEADSSVLAVLLAWLREAKDSRHSLSIRGLPKGVRSLAKLYGVNVLLPVAD